MKLNDSDIKKYLPLQTQGVAAKLDGFEIRALYKHFVKYLGQPLVDELSGDEPDADLLEKVTPAWVVLAFLESIPFLDVVSTPTGFGVVRSNTVAPASRERVEAIRMACQAAANDYMDMMLLWLEANAGSYEDWNKSCINEGSLIPSVIVFDQFVDINVSRSKFVNLKRTIIQLELTRFLSIFSAEFLAELQAGNDIVVKPLIQRALTFFAMAEFELTTNPDTPIQSLLRMGDFTLQRALSYLRKHLDTYTTYATYGYEAPYDNASDDNAEMGFFIAGPTA